MSDADNSAFFSFLFFFHMFTHAKIRGEGFQLGFYFLFINPFFFCFL
jgi:hypothetical protein